MWCKASVHLIQIFGILILNGGSYGADCPAGEEFDDTTQSCIKCRVGFYRGEDDGGLCQKCPGPFITSTSGATSERECDLAIGNKDTCPSGTEWVSMQERCITCSRGTYRVKGHDYWCVDCPGGTHTHSEGATSVLQCLDPCPLGAEWDQVLFECSPCPVDRFRSHGMTGCQSCPSGHTTVRTGSVAVNDCIPLPNSTHQIFTSDDCPSGTQWGGLLAVCEMCQINCEICPLDSYRRAGLHAQCEFCPAGTGTVLPGAGSAELCIDDSVAEAARERPPPSVNCPVGTEWNPYEVACQPCRVGFYKDHPARRICSKCDADQNTPVTGSTNASFCGQTSLSADQKPFTSGDCPLGTEWSPSPQGCRLCPVGYFRSDPSHATCASCPDAKLTKAPGASSDEDCVIPTTEVNEKVVEYHRPESCPSGSEWNSLLDGCEPCGKGYHRNKSEGLLQCQQCPEGFSTFYPGSKDISMCIVPLVGPERIPIDFISGCEPGYQPNNPRRECTACPRGTYKQDTNFDNCGYCPFNSAGETSGTRYKGTAEVSGCLQEVRVSELRPSSGALGGGYALSVYFSSRDFSERLLSVMVGGEECQLHFFKITDGHVNCTMPPSHVTGSRTISARLGDGRTLTTLEPFTYRLDPVIDSVSRGIMFAGGGANITIRGTDFQSGGNRLTITNFDGSGQPRAVDSDCVVVDLTIMRCLVPSMTHWFSNNTRRKRSTRPAPLIAHLGVDLLGNDYYKNITVVMPEYGAVYIFAGPEMESLSQTQYVVTPNLDTVISFQGIGLNEGAIKEDYQISIGSHTCVVANLSESIVTCLIPSHQAIKLAPDRSYPTTVQVGPYSFHPGDVTFTGPALTPAGAISPTPVLPSGPGTPVNDTGEPGATSPVGQPGGNNSSGASPTGPSVSASAGSGGPADSSRTTASMIQQPGITGPGTGQPGTNPGASMPGPPGLTASTGGTGQDGSPDGVTAPVGPPGASGQPGAGPGSGSGPPGAGPGSGSGPPGAGPGSDSGPPGAGPGSGSGQPGAGPGSESGPPGAGPGSGSGTPSSPGSASSAGGSSGDGGQAGGNSTTSAEGAGDSGDKTSTPGSGTPGHAPPPAGNHTVGGGGDGGKGPDAEPGNSGGQPGNTVTNNTGTPAKINTDTDNAVSPPSNNPETDVVDDKSGPDLVSILVPVLVVLCVVVTLIVTVALLYCQRRKRRKQYADGTLVRSTVSSISDPGLDAPSDGFLPPLPVDSVFGRDRVTDKGVKQRPLSLPEDGTMPTIGRTHKGLEKHTPHNLQLN